MQNLVSISKLHIYMYIVTCKGVNIPLVLLWQIQRLMVELILVKVREISILKMFNAMEMRVILKSVHPVMLEIMTVAIQRMLESAVKVLVL